MQGAVQRAQVRAQAEDRFRVDVMALVGFREARNADEVAVTEKQDDDKPTPHRSSKDTKRWCKGKHGVEHTPECMSFRPSYMPSTAEPWRELVCTACGKKLATWYPFMWKGEEKPEWVTC